jgi:hypothetical protein
MDELNTTLQKRMTKDNLYEPRFVKERFLNSKYISVADNGLKNTIDLF